MSSCSPSVCSRSILQHVVGGGRPPAARARSHTPTDPQRRQTVGREHPGEPATPQSSHRPACTGSPEPPPTATTTVTSLRYTHTSGHVCLSLTLAGDSSLLCVCFQKIRPITTWTLEGIVCGPRIKNPSKSTGQRLRVLCTHTNLIYFLCVCFKTRIFLCVLMLLVESSYNELLVKPQREVCVCARSH